MEIPIIETSRLRLRGWSLADADAFAMLNANADFARYIGGGQPINKAESWRVLAILAGHWVLKGFGYWVVEDKKTSDFLGRVGIWEPEGWPGIEVGWGISPDYWGKGYATEAALAAIEWGFTYLDTPELISLIHPENKASKSVALKVGEVYSHSQTVMGKQCDIFKLTKTQYLQNKKN